MDDVIERMVEGFLDSYLQCGPERQVNTLKDDLRHALRAVSDTHRLVPIEPTEGMIGSTKFALKEEISRIIRAAPDYTEAKDG